MNALSLLLDLPTPEFVRERMLDELFAATAAGFGCDAPDLTETLFEDQLAAYARFTRNEAERALRAGENAGLFERRLRQEAYALGERLRHRLGVDSASEALTIARPLYRAINIDFNGTPAGEVTIRSCFFRDYYTPEVCRLISAIDEGLLAGLAGGGRLVFSQRLTEGCDCCLATFGPKAPS